MHFSVLCQKGPESQPRRSESPPWQPWLTPSELSDSCWLSIAMAMAGTKSLDFKKHFDFLKEKALHCTSQTHRYPQRGSRMSSFLEYKVSQPGEKDGGQHNFCNVMELTHLTGETLWSKLQKKVIIDNSNLNISCKRLNRAIPEECWTERILRRPLTPITSFAEFLSPFILLAVVVLAAGDVCCDFQVCRVTRMIRRRL